MDMNTSFIFTKYSKNTQIYLPAATESFQRDSVFQLFLKNNIYIKEFPVKQKNPYPQRVIPLRIRIFFIKFSLTRINN